MQIMALETSVPLLVSLLLAIGTTRLLTAADEFDSTGLEIYSPYSLDERRSCGPCCCAFLDRYFDGTASYADFLRTVPVSADGANLRDIQAALRSAGYNVTPFKGRLNYLSENGLPAVLAVRGGTLNHFIVAITYERDSDSFLLFDPPRSLALVKREELATQFRGIALLVTPHGINSDNEETSLLHDAFTVFFALILFLLAYKSFAFATTLVRVRGAAALLVVVLALSLLPLCCGCRRPTTKINGAARSEPAVQREHDLGQIIQGTPAATDFLIANTDNEPLDITHVHKSCGCETVMFSKYTGIEPGEEVKVAVSINTLVFWSISKGALDLHNLS